MKKEVAEQWVAALRSGRYEQGSHWLNRGGKFCCLGVLCEIKPRISKGACSHDADAVIYEGCTGNLPSSVMRWSGMKSDMGYRGDEADMGYRGDEGLPALYELNDRGVPFSEIADVIEAEWESL